VSSSSCTELGWTNNGATQFGSSTVCASTDLFGLGCAQNGASKEAWGAANIECLSVGARLCSAEELHADEARSAGCALDTFLLWSSTPCTSEGEYEVVFGSSVNTDGTIHCKNQTDPQYRRCCADEFDTTGEFSRSPSLSPTQVPTMKPTTLSERLYPLSASTCEDLG
jgi:hypothetical protein